MTTSRMGIIGSFLVSNFSLDVVTESPWAYRKRLTEHGSQNRAHRTRNSQSKANPYMILLCASARGMALSDHQAQATDSLPGFFHHGEGGTALLYHLAGDFKFFQLFLTGQI